MLNQDVLEYVHSKVRWHAIHQTKKVSFSLNPNLNSNENLHHAINQLQYVHDYHEIRRQQSEVHGENYGKKYPTFTIMEMKEYQFWPFVAGNKWTNCTSLRVTPGSLLTSLLDVYRDLAKEGKILKYTTDIYEEVLMYKPHCCLLNQSNSPQDNSNASTKYESNDATTMDAEMTKISFTYYGISVKHLQDILKEAGIKEITVADIKKQNVSYRQETECSSDHSVAQNESDLRILTRSDEGLGDQTPVDMVGHHRRIAKRRFTTGQMCWKNKDVEFFNKTRGISRTILDPLNRKILLDKKQDERLRKKRRMEMQKKLRTAMERTQGAYEQWVLAQADDPLITLHEDWPQSEHSFFGYSWIIHGNLSNSSGQMKTGNAKQHNISLKTIPTANPVRVVVADLTAVDSWRCKCEVCTGDLHNFKNIWNDKECALTPNNDISYDNKNANKKKQMKGNHRAKEAKDATKNNSVLPVTQNELRHKKKGNVALAMEGTHTNLESRPTTKGKHPTTLQTQEKSKKVKGKKKKSKDEKDKKKYDPKIWWETVSTYTTPTWTQKKDMDHKHDDIAKKMGKTPNSKKTLFTDKLNLNYSFEKLRCHSPDKIEQKACDNTTEINQAEQRMQENPSDSNETYIDVYDTAVLNAHGILYQRKLNVDKKYLKVALPELIEFAKTRNETDTTHTVDLGGDSEILPHLNHKGGLEEVAANKEWHGKRHERIFLHYVPENFTQLCLTALTEYVVRFETVMTSKGFRRIESLTINRTPLCSYDTRDNNF